MKLKEESRFSIFTNAVFMYTKYKVQLENGMIHVDHSTEMKVYGPSTKALAFFLPLPFFMMSLPFLKALRSGDVSLFFVLIGVFGIGLALLASWQYAMRKLPQLILSPRGIEWKSIAGKRFWAWDETGDFSIETLYVKFFTLQRLVAFSQEENAALNAANIEMKPDGTNATISISLGLLGASTSNDRALELLEEIQKWQSKYRTPLEADHKNLSEPVEEVYSRIKNKARRPKVIGWLLTIVVVVWVVMRHYLDSG